MGSNKELQTAQPQELQKAFILHCCRRDYLRLLNVSLIVSRYEHDYFPLALYATFKIVEYRQWQHWDFVMEQLDALEKLFGKSHVGFLFKTAKFRAHLIMILINAQQSVQSNQDFDLLGDMTSKHNVHNLALTENIRKFSASLATRMKSAKDSGAVNEELIRSKFDELWPPLHRLINLIWELLLEALLVDGNNNLEAYLERERQKDCDE